VADHKYTMFKCKCHAAHLPWASVLQEVADSHRVQLETAVTADGPAKAAAVAKCTEFVQALAVR
jgi:hypothetical protein